MTGLPAKAARGRLLIDLAITAFVAGLSTFTVATTLKTVDHAFDFTWVWRAARVLLALENPYRDPTLGVGGPYPHDAPLFFPLPTILVALPMGLLSLKVAGTLFTGISSGVFALGLLRRFGISGLLILATPSYLKALGGLQWAPLLVGIVLLWPKASAVGLLKPNLGVALVAMQPSIRGLVVAGLVAIASLAVLPTWPLDWFRNVSGHYHTVPAVVLPFGPLLGAAWLARHRPEGRLVMTMALIPQRMLFYDQLLLLLAARTARQRLLLAYCSWLAYGGWIHFTAARTIVSVDDAVAPWVIAGCYLPALAVLLWDRWKAVDESGPVPVSRHRQVIAKSWKLLVCCSQRLLATLPAMGSHGLGLRRLYKRF